MHVSTDNKQLNEMYVNKNVAGTLEENDMKLEYSLWMKFRC